MRPYRFGPLLLLAACGDPSHGPATASAGITASASDGASTSDWDTGEPTPTTSAGSVTASTETTTSATTADETTGTTGTSEPASGTSATDTSGDTGASDATTAVATTGTSDGTSSTSTGDGTTGEPCPIGQDGCPCGQDDLCGPGLECDAGLCGPPAPPECGDGVVEGSEQCDDGNKIPGDGCEDDCTPTPAADPCGFASDGVWLEIDYTGAFTSTNPDWTYSPTPGWGEAEWAPQGESWPEVWDIWQNVQVTQDQIGKVAIVDGNGALQIMFGIGGLTYDYATVCVQGRSYSVGSSVTFTVQNQLNDCGGVGMMANDWSIHSTGVDLGTCIVDNNEFQGLRIFASGGSGALSLTRLRFTLHGAVY
ncbi:DUF4215 domain-containing protein [Nannocystis pusilla]|uniref:DUF4215 domain-containing protein n=1 Tax=Nannocystis pusilla TaxID=889268 RepID=A0ABS7U3L6_9BACT|nr:DUF4215 domain-containing protein [Nannocystis pusilla]MBZ5715024.1 DUF4215 domain-containing protein [Nannocystis pusilla]